ncbi:MAG: dTDP-4-dehydrorhamnose reductase [Bacteroidales bacterium]|nr:dTDP-4-dehydrorhamnose reductase [Bacteroidales bacterium]
MKKILVTGSKGQLGSEIKALENEYENFQIVYTDIEELDLTDQKAINSFFSEHSFDYCLNCAAYTAVDKAEEEPDLALLINAKAVEYLAKACSRNHTKLIHISTDYVFDGKNFRPYIESDPTTPESQYGRTKIEGEKAVRQFATEAVIIRTSWLYSAFGNNFVKTMLHLGRERSQLGVVFDQVGTPTYAGDLAKAMLDMVAKDNMKQGTEIYHYSNEGVISWYDFARAIFHESNISCTVQPIESKDFPAKAPRPFYSVLNKSKIKNDFGVSVPYWLDSLKRVLKQLNTNN